MELDKDIYELIDKYLTGEMQGEELLKFENEIAGNPDLANEINEQKEIIDLITEYHLNTELKNKLDKIHNEQKIKPYKNNTKKIFNNIYIISVAASVAFIVSFSLLYMTGWFEYGKHVDTYTELGNKLDNLSSTQKSIWEALISSEEDEAVKPAYPNGSSFAISTNGFLITNYHVVRNVDSVIVVNKLDSMVKFKAEIFYCDKNLDLAILQITDTNFTPFKNLPYVLSNKKSELGEYVYTLGYSKEDIVFGEGSVSSSTGYKEDTLAYEISIPVNPGNSGGPLIDAYGNIVGMISGKHSEKSGATFAIKSDYLLSTIDSVNTNNTETKIKLPSRNKIKWMKRNAQIKHIRPYVFKVEVYK